MSDLCVTGDVHGHLQLALGVAARWQTELEVDFEAVLLCGDVGTFVKPEQLDRATRRHGEGNPSELEFLTQWAVEGAAPWLELIFAPVADGGLGLRGQPIMTHGNHEGFDHLERFAAPSAPSEPVAFDVLPRVDAAGHIVYLPSGWRAVSPSGAVIAAIGGIQPGQRPNAGYHPMAYIDEDAVLSIAGGPPVDVLITHQGPAETQGPMRGSELLDLVLESGVARSWFHGHSVGRESRGIRDIDGTRVVPMRDVALGKRREPEEDSWAHVRVGSRAIEVERCRPRCWLEFHPGGWLKLPDGRRIAPPLSWAVKRSGRK